MTPAPDPRDAAEAAATEAFLSCALREADGWTFTPVDADPDGAALGRPGTPLAPLTHIARLPLPSRSAEVVAGVRHLSPTLRHRWSVPVHLAVAGGPPTPVSLPTLVGLVLDELALSDPRGGGRPSLLVERMLDSIGAVAGHLERRAGEIDRLWGAAPLPFGATEQALLLGHMVHPTPKARGEMSPAERARFSPEDGGRFALHWLAVDPTHVHHASATGTPGPDLARELLRRDPTVDPAALAAALAPLGPRVLIPAHPFEAAHLAADPATVDLFASGAVVDLGPWGAPVSPTTSVRTVHRADWPWQLKFSLHVRVTNSLRVTLPKELERAVEAARLGRTEVGAAAARIAPRFRFVHDPAFLAVRRPGGEVEPGFSVLFRDNPWPGAAGEDVSALTTLCQDHPHGGMSRLGAIVTGLAVASGRPVHDVGREWFARFCAVGPVSLLRLYLDLGLCFEAHQQNSLVELDGGWPATFAYRDSQGYFHRAAAHRDLVRVIPGLGEASESIFPEELADERLVYYLFLNLTLGVINALGVAGVADEDVLLADLRRVVERERAAGGRYPATLLDRLLDDERWPCKGNLRTRIHDLDELVGDIATQSVYVTVPNPLRRPAVLAGAAAADATVEGVAS